jgi:hypothetical protein
VLASHGSLESVRIGSRALDRSLISTRQPSYRDLMGRTFNLAVRTLVLPGIHDTQCGFKLFPGELAGAAASAFAASPSTSSVVLATAGRGARRCRCWRHGGIAGPACCTPPRCQRSAWLRLRAAAGCCRRPSSAGAEVGHG